MFCSFCGARLPEGEPICPMCGASQVGFAGQSSGNTANQNDMPMKWFKFLIYFALFAGAVLNFFSGISMLNGSVYQGNANLVYSTFEDLKNLDTIVGVLLIGAAILAIFTRFRLAGFYRNGPVLLLITYAANIAIPLIYIIGVSNIVSGIELNTTANISNMCTSAVMMFVNMGYFKKRSHLFTK